MAAQSKTPVRTEKGAIETTRSSGAEVDAFLARVKSMRPTTVSGRGRLIFAMDATMSRQPTWDLALKLQAEMFHAVKEVGGLDVQLVYFRGLSETRASKWVGDPDALARLMSSVPCQARGRGDQGQCRGLCRRLHGGGYRRVERAGWRAWTARRADVHVPGGPR